MTDDEYQEATAHLRPEPSTLYVGQHVACPHPLMGTKADGETICTHADGDHGLVLASRDADHGQEVLVVGWAEGQDMWVRADSLDPCEEQAHDTSVLHWAQMYLMIHPGKKISSSYLRKHLDALGVERQT